MCVCVLTAAALQQHHLRPTSRKVGISRSNKQTNESWKLANEKKIWLKSTILFALSREDADFEDLLVPTAAAPLVCQQQLHIRKRKRISWQMISTTFSKNKLFINICTPIYFRKVEFIFFSDQNALQRASYPPRFEIVEVRYFVRTCFSPLKNVFTSHLPRPTSDLNACLMSILTERERECVCVCMNTPSL